MRHKGTPLLERVSGFDRERVARLFARADEELPVQISELVAAALASYPKDPPQAREDEAPGRKRPWWKFW